MDEVFKALADPTRRALLDELYRQDGQSLTELGARKRGRRRRWWWRGQRADHALAAVEGVELLPDHPQRQVPVALGGEHQPQPLDVGRGVLAVPGRRTEGFDQTLGLEEPQLRDGHVGELGAEQVEHFPDAQHGLQFVRGRRPRHRHGPLRSRHPSRARR